MTQIECEKRGNHFFLKTDLALTWDELLELQKVINKAVRAHTKHIGKKKLIEKEDSIHDAVVAKQIISQKKVTKKFQGVRKEDFGF